MKVANHSYWNTVCFLAMLMCTRAELVPSDDGEHSDGDQVTSLSDLPTALIDHLGTLDPETGGQLATTSTRFQNIFAQHNSEHAAQLLQEAKAEDELYPHLRGIEKGRPRGYHRFLKDNDVSIENREIIGALGTLVEPQRSKAVRVLRELGAGLHLSELQVQHLDAVDALLVALENRPDEPQALEFVLKMAIQNDKRALADTLLSRQNLGVDLGNLLIDTLGANAYYATKILDHPQFEEFMWLPCGSHVVHKMFMHTYPVGSFSIILDHPKIKPWINAPSRYEWGHEQTALHYTAQQSYPHIYARILLNHGADANAVNDRGMTTAHLAIESNQVELLRELLPRMNLENLNSILQYVKKKWSAYMVPEIQKELRARRVAMVLKTLRVV